MRERFERERERERTWHDLQWFFCCNHLGGRRGEGKQAHMGSNYSWNIYIHYAMWIALTMLEYLVVMSFFCYWKTYQILEEDWMNPNSKCHDLSDSFMRLMSQSLVLYDTDWFFERFQKLGIRG